MTLQVDFALLPPERLPAWQEGMRLIVAILEAQVENIPILVLPVNELAVEI